uniref:Uncharacterized protein n=1 Tax=Triticum urartu TaxID=4572 RepID=A0A8R7TTE4_TRIUA
MKTSCSCTVAYTRYVLQPTCTISIMRTKLDEAVTQESSCISKLSSGREISKNMHNTLINRYAQTYPNCMQLYERITEYYSLNSISSVVLFLERRLETEPGFELTKPSTSQEITTKEQKIKLGIPGTDTSTEVGS